jgi:tRNA U55 pseudouridine synthase TruB
MGDLIRTRSGSFYLKDAVTLGQLRQAVEEGNFNDYIMPMERALPAEKAVLTDREVFKAVINGNSVLLSQVWVENDSERYWLYNGDIDGRLIGLYKRVDNKLTPEVMCYADNQE